MFFHLLGKYKWIFLTERNIFYTIKLRVIFDVIELILKTQKTFSNLYNISHRRCYVKKGVFKNLATLTEAWRPAILLKRDSNRCFSCEICQIFKNTYFEEHMQTAASNSAASLLELVTFPGKISCFRSKIFQRLPLVENYFCRKVELD